ncbi:hypothetical protein RAS2_23850 [Phycisphaerae bacterium RAS2]|nr:hypothetical protein RAS2_23850 [Phycisphaerae bacterium RAS2]
MRWVGHPALQPAAESERVRSEVNVVERYRRIEAPAHHTYFTLYVTVFSLLAGTITSK